jgi:hypothetical protein
MLAIIHIIRFVKYHIKLNSYNEYEKINQDEQRSKQFNFQHHILNAAQWGTE